MNRSSPATLARSRRLLAHEGAAGGAYEWATAAGRVYDKLHTHLDPILGAAGVQALLVRGATLARDEFACLEVAALGDSTKLRACLQAQDAAVAAGAAVALFGNFFALITAFIGERLTSQVLLRAWPTLSETEPEETNHE